MTIVNLPETAAGRQLLRETLRTLVSAETRLFVATAFDWDRSAVEMQRLGLDPEPLRGSR